MPTKARAKASKASITPESASNKAAKDKAAMEPTMANIATKTFPSPRLPIFSMTSAKIINAPTATNNAKPPSNLPSMAFNAAARISKVTPTAPRPLANVPKSISPNCLTTSTILDKAREIKNNPRPIFAVSSGNASRVKANPAIMTRNASSP